MYHGQIELERQGQLVICRPHGAFNMQGVREYEKAFAGLVAPILSKPWAIVNVYVDFETGGPEVIERIRAQYSWCVANGCRYIAFYTTGLLHNFFARETAKELGLDGYEVFESEALAIDWARRSLSSLDQ